MRIEPGTMALPRRASRGDASSRLLAALHTLAGRHGALVRHEERPWASVTFSGSRHTLHLRFKGAEAVIAGEAFIADLPEHEFAIPGQLVADATIVAVDHTMLPQPSLSVTADILMLADT